MDNPTDRHTVFFHAFEDHPSVKCGALKRGEDLILRCVRQLPAESNTSEYRVHENGAITVVPVKPQEPSLSGVVPFKPLRQCRHASAGPPGDRLPDRATCTQAGLDAGHLRMDRTLCNVAHAWNRLRFPGYGYDRSGSPNHAHDVALSHAGTDRVPRSVEASYRNSNAGAQAEPACPLGRQLAGHLVAGRIASSQLGVHVLEQRVNGDEEILRGQSPERFVPHPFVSQGADRSRYPVEVLDPA